MTDRCEPPEELRGVDGWHWVETRESKYRFVRRWWRARGEWCWADMDERTLRSFRYLCPALTPADADALRAELERATQACFEAQREAIVLREEASEWCQKVQLFEDVAQRRKNERDALSIAFTKLSAVLRVNMLRWVPSANHAQIDAAIDACLGPAARAALESPTA